MMEIEKEFTKDNFTVLNHDGEETLYYTDDISYNKLTLSFINTSATDITFSSDDSMFEFSASFLKYEDKDPAKAFKLDPVEGWEFTLKGGKKNEAIWKLTCQDDLVVPAGKRINFTIRNILLIHDKPGNFYLSVTNIPGYADIERSSPMAYFLDVKRLASKDKKPLPLTLGYTDVTHPTNTQSRVPCGKQLMDKLVAIPLSHEAVPIYLSYEFAQIKNAFKLLITTEEDIVITDKASIKISFELGKHPYQVTSPQNGEHIRVDSMQENWKVGHVEEKPSWEGIPLIPHTIAKKTTLCFDIYNIMTHLGAKEGVSIMHIQFNNLGDFADAVYRIQLIKKVAEPKITRLELAQSKITIGENAKLSWDSLLANKLEISYNPRDGGDPIVLSTTFESGEERKIELTQCEFKPLPTLPSAAATSFVATAYGPNNSKVSTSVLLSVKQRLPEIRSFRATPSLTQNGVKTKVMLSWEVSDASRLTLIKGNEKIDVTKLKNKEIEVDSATEYELVARSYGDELDNTTKKLQLFTSNVQRAIYIPFYGDRAGDRPKALMWQQDSENGHRMLFSHCGQNQMYQINLRNGNYAQDFKIKPGQFAFHKDAEALVVSYRGFRGNALYVFGAYEDTRYEISDYDGYPTQVRFSPNGRRLFFSFVKEKEWVADPLTLPRANQQQFAGFMSVYARDGKTYWTMERCEHEVGLGGMNIEFTDSHVYYTSDNDKKIYYASSYMNSYDDKFEKSDILQKKVVKMLESTTNWEVFVMAEIDDPIMMYHDPKNSGKLVHKETFERGKNAMDMLLSIDGKTLYIACIKDNKVVGVDTANKLKETVYLVDSPSCLALSKNGKLLFVGSHRSRTLTVIVLETGIISPPISTGAQAGNPMVLSVFEEKDRYMVCVTKEAYAARTKWTDADVITSNTSLDVSVINIYKPV